MRKLIERQQTSIITCDNPDCDYTEPYTDETDLALFIDKPCPRCGEPLLTQEDYLLHKRLMKNINFINRWFSWITILYPKKRLDSSDSVRVHIHDGITVSKNKQ
jgi:ssDNA-binding Zn-finger/Zn-ribbon topoisomerase 1